jgi:hypothetical protein
MFNIFGGQMQFNPNQAGNRVTMDEFNQVMSKIKMSLDSEISALRFLTGLGFLIIMAFWIMFFVMLSTDVYYSNGLMWWLYGRWVLLILGLCCIFAAANKRRSMGDSVSKILDQENRTTFAGRGISWKVDRQRVRYFHIVIHLGAQPQMQVPYGMPAFQVNPPMQVVDAQQLVPQQLQNPYAQPQYQQQSGAYPQQQYYPTQSPVMGVNQQQQIQYPLLQQQP